MNQRRQPLDGRRTDERRRAKIVYERLINFCEDPGSRDALQFLMTREITHMRAFMAALESLGKNPLAIGDIPRHRTS